MTTAIVVLISLCQFYSRGFSAEAYTQGDVLPRPGKVDPQARQHIDRMISTYRGLKSFSATAYIQGKIEQTQSYSMEKRTQIWLEKPNRLAIKGTTAYTTSPVAADKGESVVAVYDGSRISVKSSRHRSQYISRRMSVGQGISTVLMWGGMIAPGLSVMFNRPEEALYDHPLLAPYISLSVGKPDMLAGEPVITVIWEVDQGELSKTTATYYIGKENHLLRRVVFTHVFQGRTNTVTESYTNFTVNPRLPPSRFVFIPPRGAKPVESFATE